MNELLQIDGITEEVLNMTKAPVLEDIDKLDPMYVSYFRTAFQIINLRKKEDFMI